MQNLHSILVHLPPGLLVNQRLEQITLVSHHIHELPQMSTMAPQQTHRLVVPLVFLLQSFWPTKPVSSE